jgi:hypothetical protein
MNETPKHNAGEVVLYQSPDGEMRLDVRLDHGSIWLTQKQMAELFDTSADNIGLHLKNGYTEGELAEEATTEDSSVVQTEGSRRVRRSVKHYSLDAVIFRLAKGARWPTRMRSTRMPRSHWSRSRFGSRRRPASVRFRCRCSVPSAQYSCSARRLHALPHLPSPI